MPTNRRTCTECHYEFADSAERCPHCGRPGLYVNVDRAEQMSERAALDRRYTAAIDNARSQGWEPVLRDFESEVAASAAVLARPGHVVQRLLDSDNLIYATYSQELRAGLRLPRGEKWDSLRPIAANMLFGEGGTRIHFAALTLSSQGLGSYGDHFLFFHENMIAHRTSVFEENSGLFAERNWGTSATLEIPLGLRATWQERARLCVAKLVSKLGPGTKRSEFAKILLSPGKNSDEDEFIEVHIFGPITIRTLARVAMPKKALRPGKKTAEKKFRSMLAKYGVALEVIQ